MGLAVYLSLLVLFAMYAVFFLDQVSFHLFILFAVFGAVERIMLIQAKKSVYAELNLYTLMAEKKELFGKAEAEIEVMLKNVSQFLPIGRCALKVVCVNRLTGEKVKKTCYLHAGMGEERRMSFRIPLHSVGAADVTIKSLKLYDSVGMFSVKILKKINAGTVLVVPPLRQMYMEEHAFSNQAVMDSNRYSPYKKGDDVTEIFDVREYAEGDKIQQIHWKLSYKKQTLMIKEYSMPLAESIPVLVDFTHSGKKMDSEAAELFMQEIYSFSFALLDKELSQEYIWYDSKSGGLRQETVEKEEDLYLVLQEMFVESEIPSAAQWEEALQIFRADTRQKEAVYMTVRDVTEEELSEELRMKIHCLRVKEKGE